MKFFYLLIFLLCSAISNSAESSTVMHKLPVEIVDSGGTLIFSDSPEYVEKDGILYTDAVKGDARVLFYHLNKTDTDKKIAVVVEDISGKKNRIKITRGAFSTPSKDFLSVGKTTQSVYMQSNLKETFTLQPHERKLLQKDFDATVLEPGDLAYGVYDFHAEKTVQVYVIMYPPEINPTTFINSAELLPKDEQRLRGTFKNMNRTIKLKDVFNPADGIGYVLIGDDFNDLYRKGIDATDGAEVINAGNYGINYTLDFRTKSLTRFCLSPLGGVYAGAVAFKYNGNFGMLSTPEDRLFFGENTPPEPESVRIAREQGVALFTNFLEISELGNYDGKVTFEYSPPGASNLPVHFILLPVH